MAEHLDNLLAHHHFLDEAVDSGEILLLVTEIGTAALAEPCGDNHHHGGHHDADHRQRDAQNNHRGEGDADGDDGVEHL